MPLPTALAKDAIQGLLAGGAEAFRILAGKKPITEVKGAEVVTTDLTDEEFEQAKAIRDAQARKAQK